MITDERKAWENDLVTTPILAFTIKLIITKKRLNQLMKQPQKTSLKDY